MSDPELCLTWIDDWTLCHLPRLHKGTHLPHPLPWPREQVDADNPRYERKPA